VTLDDALDELYGVPPEEFVATRKRLAKQLGGDEGAAFAKLRKPSRAAAILNRLAREERRAVDLLLDAGHRLRQAGLDKAAVDRARTAESDALKQLTKAAERLGARGQALAQVAESLRAAAVTEQGRELLARGRFVEPLQASGFEAYAGLELPKQQPRPKPAPKRAAERRRAETALRELEQRLEAARAAADGLAAEVDAARRRLRDLEG
jgi:PAS domain-containing protein